MKSSTPSPPRKPGHVFVAQAAVLALLLGFLPGMNRAYPAVFNAHAELIFNAVLGALSDGRHVRIHALDPDEYGDRRDTRLVGFGPSRRPYEWRGFYRIHSRGWWPTAIVIALVLATPMPLRRRLFSVVGGVLILDALILLRVGAICAVNYGMSSPEGAERWSDVGKVVEESFNSWVPALVSVLFAWAAVAQPARWIDLAATRAWLRSGMRRRR